MAQLNFSEVPSREPLQEGIYVLTIEDIEEKVSRTNKDMLLVRFREQETQTAVFTNFMLQPESLWKLKQLVDALGIEATDMDTADLIPQLLNAEVKAKIVQRTYNDQVQNDIKQFYPV